LIANIQSGEGAEIPRYRPLKAVIRGGNASKCAPPGQVGASPLRALLRNAAELIAALPPNQTAAPLNDVEEPTS